MVRITIMLDNTLVQKLRAIQGKKIKDTGCSVSFSKVINDQLKKSLKNI